MTPSTSSTLGDSLSDLPVRVGLLMDYPSDHMCDLLDALARRLDLAVEVVYIEPRDPARRWGRAVGNLPHRFVNDGGAVWIPFSRLAVTAALNAVRADVWVVNSCYTSPTTWLAIGWLNRRNLPWVYMNEPPRRRGPVISRTKRAVLRFMLRKARGVIGTGRAAAELYRELLGDGRPTESVPYFIELSPFFELPLRPPRDLAQPIRFLTVAQMTHRKGLDVLLATCEYLPKEGWELTVIGDGPLRGRLAAAARRRWPDGRVRFGEPVPYRERAAAFAAHDVFVFPSRWDGWGMVVPESLAAGLPVISTDRVMSAQEFVSYGANGFIAAADDAVALSDRMRWFLDHRGEIPRMAEAARRSVSGYDPANGAQNLVALLSRVEWSVAARPASQVPTRDEPAHPTWRSLRADSDLPSRIREQARRFGKRQVINLSLRLGARQRPTGNRILFYHLVLREDRRRFEDHLRFITDHFHLCSVNELVERVGQTGADPTLAVSFDDGFGVLMGDCLELLEKYRVKATFYVPTGFIERSGQPARIGEFCQRNYYYVGPLEPMAADDLRQLIALGHEVGSHGVSHTSLSAMSTALARHELETSRHRLAEWLGRSPIGFAYPYGESGSSVGSPDSWLREAGYRYAVTIRRGQITPEADLMRLNRDHAEGNWSVRDLRYFLSG